MAIRKIIHLWEKEEINEKNREILRNSCSHVIFPLDRETKQEINDLIDTFLSNKDSVGLAAPQIGIRRRFFVFDPKYPASQTKTRDTAIVVINPKTVTSRNDLAWFHEARDDDLVWDTEGCLSLPGIGARVPRLKQIKLKGFDATGKAISKKFKGYPARIVQHEIDHLLGRMIIDYGERVLTEESRAPIFSRLFEKIRSK